VTVELETERLRLRQLRESDHETLAKNHADPELTRFLGGPATPVESWRWLLTMLGHWTLRGYGYWAIEEKASGDLCGAAGLIRHFDWPELEVGWRVFRDSQGRGFATEAGLRAREYAYGALEAKTLVNYIMPNNTASKRVAERMGARLDGVITLRGEEAEVYRHPHPLHGAFSGPPPMGTKP
jgi:RimJ/RimL family protein N-acetyltransferase